MSSCTECTGVSENCCFATRTRSGKRVAYSKGGTNFRSVPAAAPRHDDPGTADSEMEGRIELASSTRRMVLRAPGGLVLLAGRCASTHMRAFVATPQPYWLTPSAAGL